MPKITEQELESLKDMGRRVKGYLDNGGKLEVIINKVSQSNLTWRYSVRLWYSVNGQVDNLWLNGWLADIGNQKLTKEGYLTGYGVGTDRSFQVAYNLGHALAKLLDLPQEPSGNAGYLYTSRVVATY
jgi:hypothetical protein